MQAKQGGAVVGTGVVWAHEGSPHQHVYVTDAHGQWRVRAPHVERAFVGTGDAFTALLTGWILRGEDIPNAANRAASGMAAIMDHTLRVGSRELAMLDAQDELAAPHPRVTIERLR